MTLTHIELSSEVISFQCLFLPQVIYDVSQIDQSQHLFRESRSCDWLWSADITCHTNFPNAGWLISNFCTARTIEMTCNFFRLWLTHDSSMIWVRMIVMFLARSTFGQALLRDFSFKSSNFPLLFRLRLGFCVPYSMRASIINIASLSADDLWHQETILSCNRPWLKTTSLTPTSANLVDPGLSQAMWNLRYAFWDNIQKY